MNEKENSFNDNPIEHPIPNCNIICAGEGNKIFEWNLHTCQPKLLPLEDKTICVNFITYIDDETLLISCESNDPYRDEDFICYYNLNTRKMSDSLFGLKNDHIWHINNISNELTAVSCWDKFVRILDNAGNEKSIYSHEGFANGSIYHDELRRLYSVGDDSVLISYSLEKEEIVDSTKPENDQKYGFGSSVDLSTDKNTLVTTNNGFINFFDSRTMKVVCSHGNTLGKRSTIARFSDSKPVVMVAGDIIMYILDIRKLSKPRETKTIPDELSNTTWRMKLVGDEYFSVCSEDSSFRLYDYSLNKIRLFDNSEYKNVLGQNEYQGTNCYALAYTGDDLFDRKKNKIKTQGKQDLDERVEFICNFENFRDSKVLKSFTRVKVFQKEMFFVNSILLFSK